MPSGAPYDAFPYADLDGANFDNDQFRIVRCTFRGSPGPRTVGVAITNSQSIWGSITDCTFERLDAGIATEASTTVMNPQFLGCRTDLELASTARVDVFAWNSEQSGRLAALGPYSSLRSVGGTCQVDPTSMAARSGGLIAAHPSAAEQTISLQGMRFLYLRDAERAAVKPTIAFGPPADRPTGDR